MDAKRKQRDLFPVLFLYFAADIDHGEIHEYMV